MPKPKKKSKKLPRIQVNAPAHEIARWQRCAKGLNRSLSWWVRNAANMAAAHAR